MGEPKICSREKTVEGYSSVQKIPLERITGDAITTVGLCWFSSVAKKRKNNPLKEKHFLWLLHPHAVHDALLPTNLKAF